MLPIFFILWLFFAKILSANCEEFVCPEDKLCWPKCCKINEYFDYKSGQCSKAGNLSINNDIEVYELLNKTDRHITQGRAE